MSWASKKQNAVARSSTESEYRAEVGVQCSSRPVIWCDNISAGALAANPVFHARTKHIEVDVHFIRDLVLKGKMEVRYIPSTDQPTDCLIPSR